MSFMPCWGLIKLCGFRVLGRHSIQTPLLVSWFPFLVPVLTSQLGRPGIGLVYSSSSPDTGSWWANLLDILGDETYQTRRSMGPGTLKSPSPSFLSGGLKLWHEEAPAATDWVAFQGRCSCSYCWWPSSYLPGQSR